MGVIAKTTKTGATRYIARLRVDGKIIAKHFDSEAEAASFCHWAVAQRRGRGARPENAPWSHGLDWALGEWTKRARKVGTSPGHIGRTEKLIGELLKAGLSDITADDWARRADDWLDQHPPSLANRYRTHLRAVLATPSVQARLGKNPALGIERRRHRQKVRQVFEIEELRTLLKAAGADDCPEARMTVLLAYTGARANEAASLRWRDIQGDSLILREHDRTHKTGERIIPIQPGLRMWLDRWKRDHEHICSSRRTFWSHCIPDWMAKHISLGKPGERRTVHSFRATWAALMAATGANAFVMRLALGHASTTMTDHYARTAIRYLEQIKHEGWAPGVLRLEPLPQ